MQLQRERRKTMTRWCFNISVGLLIFLSKLLLAYPAQGKDSVLTFPGTPVTIEVSDGNWGSKIDGGSEPGAGARYSSNEYGTLGVVLLDAPVTPETKKILQQPPEHLSATQLDQFGKQENPPILRLCVSRCKPYLIKSKKKNLLAVHFERNENMRIATPGQGSQGLPAFAYEAHAFTIHGDKMLHLYLTKNVMRDAQTPSAEKLLENVASSFRSLLSKSRWE